MKKIIIHIDAPLASYGDPYTPQLQHRFTAESPTRSAIVGMIACAMGRKRGADNADIQGLSIEAVSSSHCGIERDFQTIRGGVTYGGSSNRAIITDRYYLSDHHAQVEIRGEDAIVDAVEAALRKPVWQLHSGRRAHVLSGPVIRGNAIVY